MLKYLKNFFHKKRPCFTLIEVMVVIAMIGILAAIAVPIYTNYVYRARATEGASTLGAIKTFMMERRSATGEWPSIADIRDEFDEFRELYYFDVGDDFVEYVNGDEESATQVKVILTTNDNFDEVGLTLELHLFWDEDERRIEWCGTVRDKYAKHLKPECKGTTT